MRQRGVVLVAVLWIVAALVMLVAALSGTVRGDVRGASTLRDQIVLAAAARGGVMLAMQSLTTGEASAELPARLTVSVGGRPVTVLLSSAGGWLDINAAPEETLALVLEKLGGADAGEAAQLAARIIDWRDPDQSKLPNGAEDDDYRRAGSPYRTRGEGFRTPGDLLQVLGMRFEVFDRIRNFVTTEGAGVGHPDPRSAPPALLEALGESAPPAIDAGAPSGPSMQLIGGGTVRAEAAVDAGDGRQLVVVTWLRLAADGGRPRVEVVRADPPQFWNQAD